MSEHEKLEAFLKESKELIENTRLLELKLLDILELSKTLEQSISKVCQEMVKQYDPLD
jgi:hypothetical protein